MSQTFVRGVYDAFKRRDLDDLVALHHADCEISPLIVRVDGGHPYRGHAGIREFWGTVHGAFENWLPEPEEVREYGDTLIVGLRFRGRGRDSGVPVDRHVWQAVKLRDERAVWWAIYPTRAEALEAAGLSEQAMSQENVEVVRRLNAAFNRGDIEAALAFFDPAAVWHSRADEPDTGEYQGRDAIREMARMWVGMFDDFQLDLDEYAVAGDQRVVTSGSVSGRGRASGAEVREAYAWVIRLRGGAVVEVREYSGRAEAIAAVGLSA